MLYEQFEKANCDSIRVLEASYRKNNTMEITCPDDVSTKQVVNKETEMFLSPFGVNQSCIDRSHEPTYDLKMCAGYNCDKSSFYQQPDRKNTFHNYLVVNDTNDLTCVHNHQYFNNMTRRTTEGAQKVSDPLKYKQEKIPMPVFNECPF